MRVNYNFIKIPVITPSTGFKPHFMRACFVFRSDLLLGDCLGDSVSELIISSTGLLANAGNDVITSAMTSSEISSAISSIASF